MGAQTSSSVKILICILYYLPHRTGMQLYIQRIAEELVRRGHHVTVVAARHRHDLPYEEVTNGVRVVRLWAPPVPISRGMITPSYPWRVLQLMREHDVISVHSPLPEAALVRVLAGLARRPYIVTHHGDLILPKGLANRVIQAGMFAMYTYMTRAAPALVLYSDDYAAHSNYAAPFRDKVRVIPPPITMPTPNPERAAALRAQWQHNNGPLIGYAGRFVEEKRPDVLIRALDTIAATHPHARIVFAGQYDIPYENTWERFQPLVQRYRDQLVFLGMQDDMQFMADYFAALDVLALPSDTECFALVQVESMLCGTPVVMTDIPGGRVPVQATGMGALVPPGDPVALGQTLLDVIAHRDQYVRPREVVEACFSFADTVDRYEQLFITHGRARQ